MTLNLLDCTGQPTTKNCLAQNANSAMVSEGILHHVFSIEQISIVGKIGSIREKNLIFLNIQSINTHSLHD